MKQPKRIQANNLEEADAPVNNEGQSRQRESRSDYAYHEVKAMILECRLPGVGDHGCRS
jgi:hypothetical protein